ncbi:DUF3592 domain-containing protein [Spartinivicinus ruber]|uniref:DUF3592 domain-containing protein n=1 Tax=Spartinivicinus ruber TaxID=2683272 RepID=UPI0013D57C3D|nr:DUF3592 domain-containing protein [Spartinivicinus ruber]
MNKSGITFGIIFVVIGLVCLGLGYFMYSKITWLYFEGNEASGTVVGYSIDHKWRYQEQDISYPVVEFVTDRSIKLNAVVRIGFAEPNYSVGEKVTVYYNPLNPHDVLSFSFVHFFIPLILLIGVGLLFFLFGATGLIALARGKDTLLANSKKGKVDKF